MILKLIRLLHFLIILTVILSPFLNKIEIKKNVLIFLIYLKLQHITGYKKCGLTDLEDKITGNKKEIGFIYSILNPYFNLDQTEFYKKQEYIHYFLILILTYQTMS
jgi:hypothetical protein